MRNNFKNLLIFVAMVLSATGAFGQTSAFTYQGKLSDGGAPANGQYDISFTLYDTPTLGTILGQTLRDNVQVTNGVFTVSLNFGATPFVLGPGQYLEIGVRPGTAIGVYTTLSPRQPVTSAPYAITAISSDSLSAACVLCITDGQITSLAGSKVTGTVANATTAGNVSGIVQIANGGTGIGGNFPPANTYLRSNGGGLEYSGIPGTDIGSGSIHYIQSNPVTQQLGVSFNVGGTGNADIFNAATQYNIGGNRVLSVVGDNTFAGIDVGVSNTGGANSFFGYNAGRANTTAFRNSFFGYSTGSSNSTGQDNSFFGFNTGPLNTTGGHNSFFGSQAGNRNSTGSDNSAFGYEAGRQNTLGVSNSFFGKFAGLGNSTGNSNSFFGRSAGSTNTTGSFNTLIGERADVVTSGLSNATAIGYSARVAQSNSLVLGNNANVGIGTSSPTFKLQIVDSSNTGFRVVTNATGGTVASFGGNGAFQIDTPGVSGGRLNVGENGNTGIGTNAPNAKLHVAGGSVYIANPNSLIITSPNGSCWFIAVSDTGALSTIPVTCP